MQRTDIRQSDLFVSWTGKDRELKDKIITFLKQNGITCTESDHDCAGDFRQWSRETVGKSSVFLILYTENTVNSKFVPIEIEEIQKLNDYQNRCIPVISDYNLYAEQLPELAESVSAVVLNGHDITQSHLEKILYNVQTLINNQITKVYKEATKPTYLRIASMLKSLRVAERELNHDYLYIERSLTDENNNEIANASELLNTNDILFLQGSAGSGKSCYIDQLRKAADDKTLVLSLSCNKLTHVTDLFSIMFAEFKRYCGNRDFFTPEDFKSLLSAKHLLLVLDGMDEIATEDGTRRFLKTVEEYYKINAESTTLFFTSRNKSDADLIAMNGQSPKKLTLRSLEEDQIKAFGSNLLLMLGSPEKSNDFYIRIQDLADEIRTNPLLLSQLAIIYDKKNEIPQTSVGIYDAVCEITLSREDSISDVPDEYKEMISRRLSEILKAFSAERYCLLSLGKQVDAEKIFKVVLKNDYTDASYRAKFLTEYLQNRAIMTDGEFYHKMFLEYFTALNYYEKSFDDYDEIEDIGAIEELFSYYDNPYWSKVIEMFLVKADSCIDEETTKELYDLIISFGICEYTILFDTCNDLVLHKETIQQALVSDIIKKSAEGIYPPYGPLFWYVPEYELYESCLIALDNLKEESCFAKALALVRDVCFIMGGKYTADSITDKVSFNELFEASEPSISGVRKALCELFFLGNTDFSEGEDIYPRCFNVSEAKSFMANGCGVLSRMGTPFNDELGLFSHSSCSVLNNEYIGLAALPYNVNETEKTLNEKPCKKLSGLILSPTDNTVMKYIAVNRKHIRVMYIPENISSFDNSKLSWNLYLPLSLYAAITDDKILYVSDKASLPDGIKRISSEMFAHNTFIKSLCLPPSVEIIEDNAFRGCSCLTTVDIPDSVTDIGEYAFSFCNSLTTIDIPDSVTEIKENTFEKCHSLKEINISAGVTKIGKSAFEHCYSLTTINMYEGVLNIGEKAFDHCFSLATIDMPDSVTEIEKWAFSFCVALETVNIPDSVTKIGEFAFMGCRSLRNISIPDSVTEIGSWAFYSCNEFLTANINERFKDKISGIFGKINPENIFFGSSAEAENSAQSQDQENICIPYGTEKIDSQELKNKKNIKSITIPDSVKKIEKEAFSDCISLETINIPESVTEIEEGTFLNCTSLNTINISEGITEIGDVAFCDCSALTTIDIPDSVNKIGNECFGGCSSLTTVNISKGVTEIGRSAFSFCTSLRTIDIPNNVRKIGGGVFSNCYLLSTVNLHEGITEIQGSSFVECNSLKTINIPKSVKKIGEWTFFNCRSLATIELPEGVEIIGSYAFNYCESLSSIVFPSTVRFIGDEVFNGCTSLCEITLSRRFEDDLPRILGDIDLSNIKINWV